MVKLILGRAGSGKTEYVFSHIKDLVEQGESDILLLTPEQYSFVSERKLLKELGEARVNCVTNGSFSRLASEIYKLYGGNEHPILSKGSKAVVFKKACESCKEDLTVFQKNVDNVAFINSVVNIYDEMKSCRVSNEDIMEASQSTDKETLSQKLHDISVIMSSYDNMIEGKYLDSANELTNLYERLAKLDYFMGKTVFIDGFSGFVAQEYKIIEVIIKQAKNVYITLCTNSFDNDDKYDLFSFVNRNVRILKEVTQKAGIKMDEPVYLDKSYRYNNDELKYAEKFAFAKSKLPYEQSVESISVYSAKSLIDECDYVSRNISKLLRKGIRASKIAVICRDMDKYKAQMEFSFRKYNVPFYDDERQDISSQPLIMFVNFLLRIAIYSFRTDDILSMLKTGLTTLSVDEISALENYVFLWGINGSKWKKEFTESTKGFAEQISDNDQKKIDELNASREYVIEKLLAFNTQCHKKNATDICKGIYYALLDFGVDKMLKQLAIDLNENGKSALALEQGRIWDMLMEVLDKLVTVCGEEEISIKEFAKLFSLMISNEDLGSIPSGVDNVQLGGADRIRCDNPYAVFVVGANEGEFPQNVSSAGLLTESDRVALINNDFKLYSYGETLNAQELYFAYMAISSATDKVYVSYRSGNDEATESAIVTGIKQVFPKLNVSCSNDNLDIDLLETKENAFELLASNFEENTVLVASLKDYFSNQTEFSARLEATARLVDNEDISIKDKSLATKLFKNDMYLSASRIEDYYNCAFRYFCKFGLNARPRIKAEMDPMQTGTVIHYVLENIIKRIGKDGLVNLTSKQAKELVNELLQEYYENKMGNTDELSPRFKYLFMRISKMLVCVVIRLRDEFLTSDFEPKAFEMLIGNGENNEGVKSPILTLADGGSIQIKGAIDRVDTFDKDGVRYVRVVDYKSGNKEFQLSDIINGLNLQMFIYLFILCQSDNELAGVESGVLYMHSARSVYTGNRGDDAKQISSQDKSSFKMKGVVLNDEEHQMAEHMERELAGEYIPVTATKSGDLKGSIVSLADLGRISKKINELIEAMGVNLHDGKINQNPADGKNHDKTCDFCDFRDVCINRKEIKKRTLVDVSDKEVLELLKGDDANA